MQDYEKLGAFYLGKLCDATAATTDELLLYDSKDLTTHALCVGMTGSGKTGLCLSLLEEAAIDGIPAIAIDPKGDLGNLLLTFPKLQPAEFLPWVDPGEAARAGHTPEEHAAAVAALWSQGLADWGQDAGRIRRFRESVDLTIYTPGSTAGMPLALLRSLSAPTPQVMADADALRDRTMSAVSGLLALVGIDADPVQSREHILMSNIVGQAWQAGRSLTLPDLIREIQNPPFKQLGVFELNVFYPPADRMALAMRLNSVLASPGFNVWTQGDPLDINALLYTPAGKPRLSILSIAHLSDSERMFFVTILLNEVLAWMRSQPGTSSLRALLYMDEVYGFFPPSANPPCKQPMLTLLKQARAFGLGCVLSTQNPVDLDYKGLGNTGTWFIGRLQAERDKMRLLDGLEGASAASGHMFDRARMETLISGLGKRTFLMNNVHDNEPVLFQTRWALSYLRGPLTRTQIQTLMAPRKRRAEKIPPPPPPVTARPPTPEETATAAPTERRTLPTGVRELYLTSTREPATGSRLLYRPTLGAVTRLHYAKASAKVDLWKTVTLVADLPGDVDPVDWEDALELPESASPGRKAATGAEFAQLPPSTGAAKNFKSWEKELKSHLYQHRPLEMWRVPALKITSNSDETEGDFRVRVRQLMHETRDLQAEKLRKRYGSKVETLKERIRKAEARVDVEAAQHKQHKLDTVASFGATLLGAFLGRKAVSVGTVGRAATSMRRAGRTSQSKDDIARAQATVESLNERLAKLEEAFEADVAALKEKYDPDTVEIEVVPISPRKSDITIKTLGVLWMPWAVDADGIADRLF